MLRWSGAGSLRPAMDEVGPLAGFVGDGTGRDGTGRDGTGRDGTGRDGTGRDGTGRDRTGRDRPAWCSGICAGKDARGSEWAGVRPGASRQDVAAWGDANLVGVGPSREQSGQRPLRFAPRPIRPLLRARCSTIAIEMNPLAVAWVSCEAIAGLRRLHQAGRSSSTSKSDGVDFRTRAWAKGRSSFG
jgi:hypothetical protein